MALDKFQDEHHAIIFGVLVGALLEAEFICNPVGDDEGNYKPYLQIVIPMEYEVEPIRVTIQVMPGAPKGEPPDE